MVLRGYAVAVGAALLLGAYLAGYKRYFSRYRPVVYMLYVEVAALLVYLPIAALTWSGGPASLLGGRSVPALGLLVGTGGVAGVGALASLHALRIGDVSEIAPLGRLTPLFVLPLELATVGAAIGPPVVAGALLAVAGVYLLNAPTGGDAWHEPIRAALLRRGPQLALASAAVLALVDVSRRVLLQELAFPPQAVVVATLVGIVLAVAPAAIRAMLRGDPARPPLPAVLVAGGTLAVGDHLIALAFQALPATVASPIVNAQAAVAVLLAGAVLDEAAVPRRLLATALTIAGITLLTL